MNDVKQPREPKLAAPTLGPRRQALLSIFLLAYTACLWLIATPHEWKLTRKIILPMRGALEYVGVWFDPRLFAPDPPLSLERYECPITFDNGSTVIWKYPQDGNFVGDKKWNERLLAMYMRHASEHEVLYQSLARYLAREFKSTARTPSSVKIIRYVSRIPAPDAVPTFPSQEHEQILCDYKVLPENLR